MSDPSSVNVPPSNHSIPTGVWIRRELVEALAERLRWFDETGSATFEPQVRALVDAAEPQTNVKQAQDLNLGEPLCQCGHANYSHWSVMTTPNRNPDCCVGGCRCERFTPPVPVSDEAEGWAAHFETNRELLQALTERDAARRELDNLREHLAAQIEAMPHYDRTIGHVVDKYEAARLVRGAARLAGKDDER